MTEKNKDQASAAQILEVAKHRAQEMKLTYAGALRPNEAYALLQANPAAKLVDVRSRAECDWVGRVPGAVEIEWQCYPGMQPNEKFLNQLEQLVDKKAPIFFMCRTGGRSNAAAIAATQVGFTDCYNMLEGFEGDKDEAGHRGQKNGWKASGLPWGQG